MANDKDVSIEEIVFEFCSYDNDIEDIDDMDDIETENGKPNKYQIRSALEHSIFIERIDIVKRIIEEYNIKLENQDLHLGLFYAIQNENIESMKGWFEYKVCPRYEHFEEIINEHNNEEVLDELLKYLKSFGNKGISACYRILKALCSIQTSDSKIVCPEETILPRKEIIKSIAKIMSDPLIYYSSEAIYIKSMNDPIDYKGILETIEYWEYDGYDDIIQNWIRGN